MNQPSQMDFHIVLDALKSLILNAVKVTDVAKKIQPENLNVREIHSSLEDIKNRIANLYEGKHD